MQGCPPVVRSGTAPRLEKKRIHFPQPQLSLHGKIFMMLFVYLMLFFFFLKEVMLMSSFCFQVNGRGAKEAERDSKLSISPSPSNASSNASLTTPPTNTPPEVRHRKYSEAQIKHVALKMKWLLLCMIYNVDKKCGSPREAIKQGRMYVLDETCWQSALFLFLSILYRSGFDLWSHPSAQPVPAAGQRARPPETLQQESPANGLDQEERTLQQPIGLSAHLAHTHMHTLTHRFCSDS